MLASHRPLKLRMGRILTLVALLSTISLFYGLGSLFLNQNTQAVALAQARYSTSQVVTAVNNQRIAQGLPSLSLNTKLVTAASNKAGDMANNSYFAHVSPSGVAWSNFIRQAGYDYLEAGENLANGFDDVNTMVQAWMNSPTHRENILNPNVTETGVAIQVGVLDGYDTVFVVQMFGREDLPVPISSAQPNTQELTIEDTAPRESIEQSQTDHQSTVAVFASDEEASPPDRASQPEPVNAPQPESQNPQWQSTSDADPQPESSQAAPASTFQTPTQSKLRQLIKPDSQETQLKKPVLF